MILFSWTLTPAQIGALRAVADHQAAYESIADRKDRKALSELRPACADYSHWISSTKGLIREGFIRHIEVPLQKWELGVWGNNKRQSWEITQKGRLLLEIVAIEIEEQSRVLASDRKVLKLLAA